MKKKKKLNNALKRRIRRTTAVILLISSMVIAAIPVPDAAAADTTYSEEIYPGQEVADGVKKADKISSSSLTFSGMSGVTNIPTINKETVGSAKKDTVFCTGDGLFQFVWKNPSGSSDFVAVIVGFNSQRTLPGGALSIPEKVDAYKQVSNTEGTGSGYGYQAVDKAENLLYYITQEPTLSGNDPEYPIGVPTFAECFYSDYDKWVGKDLYRKQTDSEKLSNFADPTDLRTVSRDPAGFYYGYAFDRDRVKDMAVSYIAGTNVAYQESTNEWIFKDATKIGEGIFSGGSNIISLSIPSCVLAVGNYAFSGCTNLNSVTLKNGLCEIGKYAFASCRNLQTCDVEENAQITTIQEYAFLDCASLQSFSMPNAVINLCDGVFENCISLKNVYLCAENAVNKEVALTNLGDDVFKGCTSLSYLNFPDTMSKMGYGTFKGCESIQDINFGKGYANPNTPLSIFNGCKSLKHLGVNNRYFNLIPVTTTSGSSYAYGFDNFKYKVDGTGTVDKTFYVSGGSIADSGTTTDSGINYAVHNTTYQNAIAFAYNDGPELETYGIYEMVDKSGTVSSPLYTTYWVNNSNELVKVAYSGSETDYEVNIPEYIGPYFVQAVGSNFKGNTQIGTVNIPATVTSIADEAFLGCYNLHDVKFADATTMAGVGANAFKTQQGASGTLKELTMQGAICNGAGEMTTPFLYAMNSANNYNAPSQGITYIRYMTPDPTDLVIQYNPETGLRTLTDIPENDGTVVEGFSEDSRSTLLTKYFGSLTGNNPHGLTEAELQVVYSMTDVELPYGIQAIDKTVLQNDHNLMTIKMDSIEKLEPNQFEGCNALTDVTMLSSGVAGGEVIGDYAFKDCSVLKKVSLPSSLSTLGLRPFTGCTSGDLSTIDFNGSTKFTCEDAIIYGLDDTGAKSKVIECLENRGSSSSSTTTKVTSAELEGIKELAEEAFMGCDSVKSVDLSTSKITKVPKNCFAEMGTISEVVLPTTCNAVEEYAFKNSDSLSYLTLPASIAVFDANAFATDTDGSGGVINGVEVTTSDGSIAKLLVDNGYGSKFGWKVSTTLGITYKVYFYDSFDEDHPALISDQMVDSGADAVPPEPPTHEGYVFDKWRPSYKSIGGDTSIYGYYVPADAEKYTVNFYDWDLTLIITREVLAGEDAEEPKDPTREGYTFTGWSKPVTNVTSNIDTIAIYKYGSSSTSGNENPTNGTNGTSGTAGTTTGTTQGSTVTNTVTPTTYPVTVVNGSGSGSYVAGATVVVAANTPANGYGFYNWTSSSNITLASTTLSATTFVMPAAAVTVTANYKTVSGNNITSSSKSNINNSANRSSVSSNTANRNTNTGTKVSVTKPGISNTGLASASVSGSTDNFVVKVSEDASATEAVARALKNEYGDLTNIRYFAMDISLYDATGNTKITDTTGLSVSITLPIPDELLPYAGNNKIAGIVNEKLDKLTPKFSTIDGVACMTFTATHFSPYTMYVDTANLTAGVADASPTTGDGIHPKWFLAIGLACLSIVLFLKKDKKVAVKMA